MSEATEKRDQERAERLGHQRFKAFGYPTEPWLRDILKRAQAQKEQIKPE